MELLVNNLCALHTEYVYLDDISDNILFDCVEKYIIQPQYPSRNFD